MSDRTIVEIPFDQLHDSPFNPKARATLAIDELAANIKAEGRVHEALLVRPRIFIDGVRRGDANADPDDTQDGFEIVFGHRRRYAAEVAGLATVPCEVRAMSDAEARSAQAAENLQREGLKALEEAAAYQAMIDKDGLTPNEVAEAIGKSRSHVYGRLRLLDLCDEVRSALTAGEVQAEVALLIARVGGAKLQGKALGYIRGKYWDLEDGGAKSYRQIRYLLNERFTLQLNKALFDPADAALLVDAGACTDCPKRSGNAPEFDDVVGPETNPLRPGYHGGGQRDVPHGGTEVCTDPDCFDAKKRAHLKRKAGELEAAGKTVIDGAKARLAIGADGQVKGAYVPLAEVKAELKQVAGDKKPDVVTIQDPRTGKTVQAVKREDLKAAGVKVAEPKPQRQQHDWEAERKKREEEYQRNLIKAKGETRIRIEILQAVRQAMAAVERSQYDMHLLAGYVLDATPYDQRELLAAVHGAKGFDELRKTVGQLDMQACALLMLDCALLDRVNVGANELRTKPVALLEAATHYGVDVEAIRARAQTPATPEVPAAKAKAKAGKPAAKKAKAAKAQAQQLDMLEGAGA